MCIMFVPCGAAADQDGGKEINLSPSDLLQTHKYYSVLKLLTGFSYSHFDRLETCCDKCNHDNKSTRNFGSPTIDQS